MSDVLVGSAHALLTLKYEQFTQGVGIVEQQIARLQALVKTPITVQAQIGGASSSAIAPLARSSGGASGASGAAEYDRLQRAQAALEAQQARLARTQGDGARAAQLEAQAQQRLTDVLAAQSGVTVQSIATERQLATVQQQAARAAQQNALAQRAAMDAQRAALTRPPTVAPAAAGGGLSDLGKVAQFAGVGLGAAQLVSLGKGALDAANSLEQTEATVRALSGSQERYNEVLAVARTGQQAYGGSLESNLAGLGTLVNLSNRAGVSLGTLDNISRRLAIVDPAQGIEGANIALKEFLSGDNAEAALSLARRFELPRAALQGLAREGVSAKDRLDGLNKLLNEQGITSQVLSDRLKTQAATYVQFSAAILNARDALGGLIATQGASSAKDLTGGLTGITQLIGAYNDLARANKGVADTLGLVVNPIGEYNRAVLKYGAEALRYIGALAATEPVVNQSSAAIAGNALQVGQSAALVAQAEAAQLGYANALEMGGIQARAAALASGQKSDSDKLASIDAQTHALAQKQLDDQVRSATDALLAAGPAGARMAALLAQSSSGVDVLTAAQYRLETATIAANNAANQKATNQVVAVNRVFGRDSGRGGGSDAALESAAFVTALQKRQAEQQKLLDSEIALAGAKKQTGREIDLLRQKQSQYAKGTAEFNQIQAQIISIQTAAGKTRVSAAQSTALQLNNVEENSGLALLKTQRENLERLRDQQEDFDVRRTRSQEDYQEKRRSLLAHGQRAQALALAKEYEKDTKRAQEDFERQKGRTLRNNAEGTGDIGNRADLRGQQIAARAALRGVRADGRVDLGAAPPLLTPRAPSGGRAERQPIAQITIAPQPINLDGKTIATAAWPTLELLVDDELAVTLRTIVLPGSGQTALDGGAP